MAKTEVKVSETAERNREWLTVSAIELTGPNGSMRVPVDAAHWSIGQERPVTIEVSYGDDLTTALIRRVEPVA